MADRIVPPDSEEAAVYDYNHHYHNPPKPHFDPIEVHTIDGRLKGFTWTEGDSITLKIPLDKTLLKDPCNHDFKGERVEFEFRDVRGGTAYTFYSPACLDTTLELNIDEDSTIASNEYRLHLTLISKDGKRTTLLREPLWIYVK